MQAIPTAADFDAAWRAQSYDCRMSRDRRSARSDVPRRTPGQLIDALRDLAADGEEPLLSPRRRFVGPIAVSGRAAAPTEPDTRTARSPTAEPPLDVDRERDAQPGGEPKRINQPPERDAEGSDVLRRRSEPARIPRPPSRARRDPATPQRRPSAGAGRPQARLSPRRLGAGVLGLAVIVITVASLLSGGSNQKPATHRATTAHRSLPATTIAAPALTGPQRTHKPVARHSHSPRAHRTQRSAGHRHRHLTTTARHARARHRARTGHRTARHHRRRTRHTHRRRKR